MYAEVCDITFSYALTRKDFECLGQVYLENKWPAPRENPVPFNHNFTDFLRVVGPGVFVGLGYRQDKTDSGMPLFPRPLYFLMVADGDSARKS